MTKTYLSWADVESFVRTVADTFKSKEVSGVYGIPRGGLTLSVMLSHKMNIPLLLAPMDNCIIIDDIWDSGESMMHYVNNSSAGDDKPTYYTITMMYNINSSDEFDSKACPNYYWGIKDKNWIVFPWENV